MPADVYKRQRKTRSHISTKADVFLAGIASQLTVIVAYADVYKRQ